MKTSESGIRDLLRLVVWYPVRWLLAIVPAWLGIKILLFLGDLHYFAGRKQHKVLSKNLMRIGIAPRKHPQIIRSYLRNHYLDQLFILVFPHFTADNIKKYVHFSGLKHLDAALSKKRGVVLVHGHYGPAHLPLVALALRGYPMKQVGNPSDKGLSWIGRNVAFRIRMAYEQKMPAKIIKTGSFLRPVFKALQQNQVIMITGDGSGNEQKFGRQHCFKLLDHPVELPLGPALLSEKTKAPLLPLFILPGKKIPFTVIIEKEICATEWDDSCMSVIEKTATFSRRLEHYIIRNPGYMHFLDRFSPGQVILSENNPAAQA